MDIEKIENDKKNSTVTKINGESSEILDVENVLNSFYFEMAINELRLMNSTRTANISYNSLLYLDLIAYKNLCTSSYIADALGIAKSAVTVKVNELCALGLVEKKQSDEDKRIFYLSVPTAVREDYRRYDKVMDDAVCTIKNQYSSEEMSVFCSILHCISAKFAESVQNGKQTISKSGESIDDKCIKS